MKQEQLEGVMQLLRAKIDGTRKEIERAKAYRAERIAEGDSSGLTS